jgi:GcrA cell cycle regulator
MSVTEQSGVAINGAWTPERTEMLLDIWPRGFSASQTAAMIGGVSRNAVIGKVHRLKLAPRHQDSLAGRVRDPEVLAARIKKANDRRAHNQRVARAKARGDTPPQFKPSEPAPELPQVPVYVGSLNVPFADLGPTQCRFIEGQAPEFLSCGNDVIGGAWCHHHQQIVWVKPEHRRATSYDANRRGRKVSNFSGSYEPA